VEKRVHTVANLPRLPELLSHVSFVFNGLGGNSLQAIDCHRFIAIHLSCKELYLQVLAHFADSADRRGF
jgi:hypothetical protein